MEDANRGFRAEPCVDRAAHAVEIARELRVIVVGGLDRNVAAVIAEVEHQHVVARRQQLPERQIGVGGKSVAVRDREPHAVAIAVPANEDFRPILEIDIECLARCRNDEIHALGSPHFRTARQRAAHGSRFARPCDDL
jgi:hypothetical protein